MTPVSNSFSCNSAEITNIRAFIDSHVQQVVPPKTANLLVIAVDEVCTNLVEHGVAQNIDITLSQDAEHVIIQIRDTGKSFDLTAYQPKSIAELISIKSKGGLGLCMVQRIMDQITYERVGDQNVCTMYKKAA